MRTVQGAGRGATAGRERLLRRTHRVVRRLHTGVVWINGYGDTDPSVPFGGLKQSGYDRECSRDSIDSYADARAVYARIDPAF